MLFKLWLTWDTEQLPNRMWHHPVSCPPRVFSQSPPVALGVNTSVRLREVVQSAVKSPGGCLRHYTSVSFSIELLCVTSYLRLRWQYSSHLQVQQVLCSFLWHSALLCVYVVYEEVTHNAYVQSHGFSDSCCLSGWRIFYYMILLRMIMYYPYLQVCSSNWF